MIKGASLLKIVDSAVTEPVEVDNQILQTVAQPAEVIVAVPPGGEPAIERSNEVTTADTTWLWLPLIMWCVMIWSLLMMIRERKMTQSNVTLVRNATDVPCRGCQFFSGNPYLYCAIRPTDALTERAIDCADYCQKQNQKALGHQNR